MAAALCDYLIEFPSIWLMLTDWLTPRSSLDAKEQLVCIACSVPKRRGLRVVSHPDLIK